MKTKIISLFLVMLLSGCYNYHELSEIAITTAIGIDKDEYGYKIISQVMNIKKKETNTSGSGNTPEVILYETSNMSLKEGFREIILKSPKRVYPSHLNILLISEEVARDDIKDILEVFFRDPLVRMQFNVLITKNCTSEEVLETLTPSQMISSKSILESQKSDTKYLGSSQMITFERLMDLYLDDNKNIVLPSVIINNLHEDNDKIENIEKSNNSTEIILDSTGIFKDTKLIDYINNDESIYLNYVKGMVESSLITCNCEDGKYFTSQIDEIKSGVKYDKIKKEMILSVSGNATVNELNCNIDIDKEDGIYEVEKLINDNLSNNIFNFINKIKNDYNIDIFNFLDIIYKNDYEYYKEIKDSWDKDGFRDINVVVKIDISVTKKGNVLRDTYDEKG